MELRPGRDISESGAWILSKVAPPAGAWVRLRVFLEASAEAAFPIRLQIDGHEFRVDEDGADGGVIGIAVLSDKSILKVIPVFKSHKPVSLC